MLVRHFLRRLFAAALKTTLRISWILLCLALALAARCWNVRDVLIEGHIYFVDGDCYSRMTRARMIAEHPGMIVRHHDFENWPQGITTHTTAPLDYLIVGLKDVLEVMFRVLDPKHRNLLHDQPLDLAGALISPLLGLAGAIFLAWWVEKFRVRFGSAALLIYAVSPILVHGTLLGRPDHQSLEMTLITVAIGAELALARGSAVPLSAAGERNWGIVSGLAWSLNLWVSLYEPVILLAVVLALWGCLDRRSFWSRSRLPGAAVFVGVLLATLALEGWSVEVPNAEIRAYFANWEQTVGELLHLNPSLLFAWVGWGVIVSPVLLLLAWRQDRRALPLLVLLGAVVALSVWQLRWGYFLGIVFAWTLPWQMQAVDNAAGLLMAKAAPAMPGPVQALLKWSVVWPLFVAGLWPILNDWDTRLFPKDVVQDQQMMVRVELAALRGAAVDGIGANGGPFLASWWLSPAVAYWSHQPGVAGTSHESLPGIVDTAQFFLSTDPEAAAAILRKRPVRWVLAGDPGQEISTSSTLLGLKPVGEPLATTLYDHPENAPDFLREWEGQAGLQSAGLRFYRLYEVIDDKLPR